MKYILISILCIAGITTFAQSEIKVEDAKNHAGETVKICTKIYGGKSIANARDTLTLLDAGKPYPDAPLRLVIKGKAQGEFVGDIVKYYQGMNVCISGKIELYKGKPEIHITEKAQIFEQMKDKVDSKEPK